MEEQKINRMNEWSTQVRNLIENPYVFHIAYRQHHFFSFAAHSLPFCEREEEREEKYSVNARAFNMHKYFYCIISFSYFMVFILLINHPHINRLFVFAPPTPREKENVFFLCLCFQGMSPFSVSFFPLHLKD